MSKPTYILATRQTLSYHYNYLLPYFKSKYIVVDSDHSSGNPEKKADPLARFLFEVEDEKELTTELDEFGMDWNVSKRIKLSK